MPYAPNITDRSGEIRAQGMLQGGMGLLGGFEAGMEELKRRKEEDKKRISSIKANETVLTSILPIAGNISPDMARGIQETLLKLNDSNLTTQQRADIGASMTNAIGELMKMGVDMKKNEADKARQDRIAAAQVQEALARKRNEEVKAIISGGMSKVLGAEDRKKAIADLDPITRGFVLPELLKLEKETSTEFERTDPNNGVVYNVRRSGLYGTETAVPKILADGTVVMLPVQGDGGSAPAQTAPTAAAAAPQGGAYSGLASAASGGGMAGGVVPRSAADRAIEAQRIAQEQLKVSQKNAEINAAAERRQEDAARAKTAQDAEKKAALKRSFEISSSAILKNISEAKELVGDGAGGTFSGQPWNRAMNSAVGGVIGIGQGAKNVETRYKAIRGALRFLNLKELKEAGATPGTLSNAEGEALENAVAVLDTSLDEGEQIKALDKIEELVNKLGGRETTAQAGATPAGQTNYKGTDQILEKFNVKKK